MGAILERTNFELNDLTFVPMERIIVHWTGGVGKPNHIDKAHYHILIDEDGNYILGDKLIKQNKRPITGKYAAHTWKRNTGPISVSLCGMRQSDISNNNFGPNPITEAQYDALIVLLADLCDAYDIEVSRKTVLFHSEVEEFLKTKQRGKVDIDRLPWDTSLRSRIVIITLKREMFPLVLDGLYHLHQAKN
jgi:N-acetyl-anhydromuramyl-L-alanine amidase AmpD